MKLKAKDYKAIKWYAETYDLKPQLSAPPTMYFKDAQGREVTHNLGAIVLEWSQWNENDQKDRARERKIKDTRRAIKKAL